eukprot:TRINITY_DN37794_c0_g1_i2.p1 TRINITY_DN37794_c0_g1~~TRINITY_DN37794_c0_g1_i2.p1  ORF type:complete len:663 (-),score=148.50 TRINITY_DN37794_c0_g1_i2:40-2028(-)
MPSTLASSARALPPPGIDFVAQLNFAGPRDFLVQVEDDLDVHFCLPSAPVATTSASPTSGIVKQEPVETLGLAFPPLAACYEELLRLSALRFGLELETTRRTRTGASSRQLVVKRPSLPATAGSDTAVPDVGPLFSVADFLMVQRPALADAVEASATGAANAQAPPQAGSAAQRRLRARLRSAVADAAASNRDTGDCKAEALDLAASADAAEQRAALDALFAAQASAFADAGGAKASRRGRGAEEAASPERLASSGAGARKRGRGFESTEASGTDVGAAHAAPRHCYRRFGPQVASRLYLRDDFARAPWPSAKLRRLQDDAKSVQWRSSWRVGYEANELRAAGGELRADGADCRRSAGAVLSWAVEPSALAVGEGFEVRLRCGPGPDSSGRGDASGEEDEAIRDGDFLLRFRRGAGEWRFSAGHRQKLGAVKALPDHPDLARQRHMFWVACLECCSDGRHYVIVGTVPGILTEHFFVAKVARAEPLTHAGFAYLPPLEISERSGQVDEAPALVIESITVFPHVLTGNLPFVSLRHVDLADAYAEETGDLARAPLPGADGCELRLLPRALPDGGAKRFEAWCESARRECGLPLLASGEGDAARREARRARRRLEPPEVAPNPLPALNSWTSSSPVPGAGEEENDDVNGMQGSSPAKLEFAKRE